MTRVKPIEPAMTIRLALADTPARTEAARALFVEYANTLGFKLCFQGFDQELAGLPGAYAPPHGTLLLALDAQDHAVGCVGVRPLAADDGRRLAELKRLYVQPDRRGSGLGARLTAAALAFARADGYAAIRLDTLPSMRAAIAMYEALGFRDIAPYYDNPIAGARYLELALNRIAA